MKQQIKWEYQNSGVWQGYIFSPDLFNLYNKMKVRKLEDPLGFIINRHSHNNIHYIDDTDDDIFRSKTEMIIRQGSWVK